MEGFQFATPTGRGGGKPGKIDASTPSEAERHFLESGGEIRTVRAEELFTIEGNKQLNKNRLTFSAKSAYPYFTRTENNNGILGYVDYLDEKHKISGNSLAIGMIAMKFFFMKHDFYAGQFTKTAFPLFEGFNERVALWFATWFNKSSSKYKNVLVRDFEQTFYDTELQVPYINGAVATNFISERVREIEEQRIRELDAWLRAAGLDDCELTEEEETAVRNLYRLRMREIRIGDLMEKAELKKLNKSFDKKKDLSTYPDTEHPIPITNAKLGNNGIMFWAKRGDFQTVSMSIDIVQNGAVATGKVYPQPQETTVLWDSYLVELKHQTPTDQILFFLATAMEKVLYPKYTYEYKAYWDKVKEDYILLPVTDDGTPDYHFMTIFISAVKKLVVKSVVDFVHSSQ